MCQVEGSMLASQFCGRWEETLKRCSDWKVFLDYDADIYHRLLHGSKAAEFWWTAAHTILGVNWLFSDGLYSNIVSALVYKIKRVEYIYSFFFTLYTNKERRWTRGWFHYWYTELLPI